MKSALPSTETSSLDLIYKRVLPVWEMIELLPTTDMYLLPSDYLTVIAPLLAIFIDDPSADYSVEPRSVAA